MTPLRNWSGWSVLVFCALHGHALAQTRWSLATPLLPFMGQGVATYDPVANRAIVVNLMTNTTWAVSSTTGVWSQVTQATGGPGWITDPALAYDSMRQQAVLFGGAGANGTPLASTWELAGSSWQQPNVTVSPQGRHNAGMCFDAGAGVVRLAGGDGGVSGATTLPLSDVWTFDGVQWTQLPASAAGPVGATTMTYDWIRGCCVALAANGTFEWQGSAFVPIATTTLPPPRRSTALVYDAFRQRVVLFGGRVPGASSLDDVWEYDGNDWMQRQPLGLIPRRHMHAMVFDSVLQAVRLFAGIEFYVGTGGAGGTSFIQGDELRYEPVSPPIAAWFAPGCYFAMNLASAGVPWLGETFGLTMQIAGTGLPPLMVLGTSNQQFGTTPLPLPVGALGFPNCELVVSPDVLVLPMVSGTVASLAIVVPNQPQLLGARLFAQGFEPNLTNTGTGTNGLLLQVGGR